MSIKLNDVRFNLKQIANEDKVLLVEVKDYFEYVDGEKQNMPSGKTYICVLPKRRYEIIRVKTFDRVSVVPESELKDSDGIYIKFTDDFSANFYSGGSDNNYSIGLSCKATSAIRVSDDNKLK